MDNKKSAVLLFVILALVVVTLACVFISGTQKASPVFSAGSGVELKPDSIKVYGQGKVSIEPDIAYVTFGYDNLDTDPKKAQDDNSAEMDNIIKAVKSAGIEDADIQTLQYSVYQEYDYSDNVRKIKGYRVTNMLQVKVRDVTKAGVIIKAAYDAGSNIFSGIRFDIIKREEAYLEALHLAMQRAEEKAGKLAAYSGRSITGVISVEETSSSDSHYSPYSNFV